VGISTQNPELRRRLDVQVGAERLAWCFDASVALLQVLARACGHPSLSEFSCVRPDHVEV
jgi:glutamate synthase domain-containing protein 2